MACLLTGPSFSAQMLSFHPSSAKHVVQSESPKITLRDALFQYKKHYGMDILFEEKLLEGITILPATLSFGSNAEKSLTQVLKPFGLKVKKVNQGTFVILAEKVRETKTTLLEVESSGAQGSLPAERPVELTARLSNTITEIHSNKPAEIKVTGSVSSESSEKLPGVNVVIKGTQRGTATDENGNFQIDATDENSVLIFSFIGHIKHEIVIGKRTSFNIVLKADDMSLNEIVVVG